MIRCTVAILVLSMLAACGADERAPSADRGSAAAGDDAAASTEVVETYSWPGEQTYRRVCADCHDEGVDAAPRIGHPEDWEGRSRLWAAVLFEHARAGYLDMPARGGDEALDDATVAKAAEYMLRMTFPDMPRDTAD